MFAFYNTEFKPPSRVRIFDTTLRDGEQTPGVALNIEQKVLIAKQLNKLGVDIIEAGFPAATKGEKEAVKVIKKLGLNSKICGLARCKKEDIDTAIDCDVDIVHIFIPTSDIQIKYTIKKSKEEILNIISEMVSYVKEHGVKCLFSAMDATRTDIEFLINVFKVAEESKADIINIPDTVGIASPEKMFNIVKLIRENVKIPIDVHCHNDLGLAVANSVASVLAGADGVQVTINGLGERAGNASLEQVVMILHSLYNIKTNIRTEYLYETSKLVERLTGIKVMPNYPIVGDNAFSHESGIHTHGVVQKPETFEPGIVKPEMIGHKRRIIAGKHSGIHGLEKLLKEMGYELTKEQVQKVVDRVKELGDKGKKVTEADLQAIVEDLIGGLEDKRFVELEELAVMTGNKVIPTASVKIKFKDRTLIGSDTGVGPVDAAIKAIRRVIKEVEDIKLVEYRLEAISGGSDALASVTVILEDQRGIKSIGRAVREDIVMASVEAMIQGINRIFLIRERIK